MTLKNMTMNLCYLCHLQIESQDMFILTCTLCNNTCHAKCALITKNNFKFMSVSDKEGHICWVCKVEVFPFNHIMDDDEFIKCITNTCLKDIVMFDMNLVYVPVTFENEKTHLPLCNEDPIHS